MLPAERHVQRGQGVPARAGHGQQPELQGRGRDQAVLQHALPPERHCAPRPGPSPPIVPAALCALCDRGQRAASGPGARRARLHDSAQQRGAAPDPAERGGVARPGDPPAARGGRYPLGDQEQADDGAEASELRFPAGQPHQPERVPPPVRARPRRGGRWRDGHRRAPGQQSEHARPAVPPGGLHRRRRGGGAAQHGRVQGQLGAAGLRFGWARAGELHIFYGARRHGGEHIRPVRVHGPAEELRWWI
mmetsp:Transcript_35587/g.87526  ORF Transcript_35587/g.87526 Transcript_35587/m.87526 type:complete len:248 (+) Transcript_35587:525-1268(+)